MDKMALDLFFERYKLIRILKVITFSFIFIILIFLLYYFITTYSSIKLYKISIDSDSHELIDSYFIKTRDKIYMNLKTCLSNSEDIKYVEIFYKINKKEKKVISTTNIQSIMIVDYLGYEEYFNFKKLDVILDNLYIKIAYDEHIEILKLNLKKDYSNSNILLNINKNVSKNQVKYKATQNISEDFFRFKGIICQTKNCAIDVKYNDVMYNIFYLSETNEIIVYFKNKNKYIQYKYNFVYNNFYVIKENKLHTEEYQIDLLNNQCILHNCDFFEKDYLLFQNILKELIKLG